MPDSRACRMVARDASSSCGPHPKDHPPPPMAHAPKPTLVIMTPLEPSGRLDNCICSLLLKAKTNHAKNSTEAKDGMRRVRFLERSNLVGRQVQRQSCYCVLKMMRFSGSDNRCGDPRLAEQPGQRKLGAGNSTLFGNLPQVVHDFMVGLFRLQVHPLAELVCFIAFGGFALPG